MGAEIVTDAMKANESRKGKKKTKKKEKWENHEAKDQTWKKYLGNI